MNIFFFFFLTTAVVTAAPHVLPTSGKHQHKSGKPGNSYNHECQQKSHTTDRILLQEIIKNVKDLKTNLTEKTLKKHVQNVFMKEECNCETLCKAGNVLLAYNASNLGLKSERDWRLPRRLHAYSNQTCTNTDKLDTIPLEQLLDKIRHCAQESYVNY